MNLTTKKTILKTLYIYYLILIAFFASSLLYNIISTLITVAKYSEYLGNSRESFSFVLLYLSIIMLVYICIYLSLALYYRAKSRQTKEQFYKRIIILKIVSILEILINPIVAVLIIITAFKKDDGLDEIIIPPKPKKKKFVLPKELRPKLKKLKFDRRHGYISSEVYEKQYNKLLKEAKHLEEQKLAEMEQIEQAKVIELNKQTEEESPKQQPNEQTTQTEEQTKNQETTTQTKEDSLKGTTQE